MLFQLVARFMSVLVYIVVTGGDVSRHICLMYFFVVLCPIYAFMCISINRIPFIYNPIL